MGAVRGMYKPKKSNEDKLDRYIEKLRKNGELLDDSAEGNASIPPIRRKTDI